MCTALKFCNNVSLFKTIKPCMQCHVNFMMDLIASLLVYCLIDLSREAASPDYSEISGFSGCSSPTCITLWMMERKKKINAITEHDNTWIPHRRVKEF